MTHDVTRRAVLAGSIAMGLKAAGAAAGKMPTIKLGKHEVSRMIAGYNPIGGYSHSVPKLDALMKDWFTVPRVVSFIEQCEKQGINTWQAGPDPKVERALKTAWDKGSKIQWISLMKDGSEAEWKAVADMKPVAAVHHGEVTDKLFKSGEQGKIQEFLKKARDHGMLAGVSSHSPENIAAVEGFGWEPDLFMTCFYNIRRETRAIESGMGDLPVDELYLSRDPERMTKVVRSVKRPCLAFKILAAGRKCKDAATMQAAFDYAFANIKPGDGVIVGMFPILTDEVAEDAGFARKAMRVVS